MASPLIVPASPGTNLLAPTRAPGPNPPPAVAWPAGLAPAERDGDLARLAGFKAIQDALRPHLDREFMRLFRQLTGVPLRVFWLSPVDSLGPGLDGDHCPQERRLRRGDLAGRALCQECLGKHWLPAGSPASDRHRFTGDCGLETCWVDLSTRGLRTVRLVIQIPPRLRLATADGAGDTGAGAGRARRFRSGRASPADASRFERAVALLHLLLRGLDAVAQSAALGHELEQIRRQLRELQRPARLLPPAPPAPPAARPRGGATHRSPAVVQLMLDYIHRHYDRPMTLSQVAASLGMNASYLSALFSRTIGMTFHRFLDEFRLLKAKQLLTDPRNRISDIAVAVGYSSDDWFRHAFKARTGLSPSAWRQAGP